MEHINQSLVARRTARRWRFALSAMAAALVSLLSPLVGPVAAGSGFASPWQEEKYVRVRLVDGGTSPDGTRMAGVQIELNEGFYTYWRNPGDSGVPPQFSWDRSQNLAGAEPKWPAPTRLESDYGVSFGYHDQVVFPITVVPVADGPIQLNLDLTYAACSKVCYLLTAKLDLTLPAVETSSSAFTSLVEKSLSRVPLKQAPTGTPRVSSVTPTMAGDKIILKVTAELARADDTATLFVEGPEQYYFRVPGKPAARNGNVATFDVGVEGAGDIASLKGAELITTLVTPSTQVEHRWAVE